MSAAAAARAHVAAIGRDLADAGLGAAFLHAATPARLPARTWADLSAVPDWLRLKQGARRHLALRVALLAMAPALTSSIDGAWLGALAEQAGEDALDWAMKQAGDVGLPTLSRIEEDALERTGLAILAASLPATLRRCLPPVGAVSLSGEQARVLVERAR